MREACARYFDGEAERMTRAAADASWPLKRELEFRVGEVRTIASHLRSLPLPEPTAVELAREACVNVCRNIAKTMTPFDEANLERETAMRLNMTKAAAKAGANLSAAEAAADEVGA